MQCRIFACQFACEFGLWHFCLLVMIVLLFCPFLFCSFLYLRALGIQLYVQSHNVDNMSTMICELMFALAWYSVLFVGLCTFFKLLNSQSKQHSVLDKLELSFSFVLQTFRLPWFLLLLSLFVSGFACRCLVLSRTCAHVPSSNHKFVALWCTLIRKINAFDMADIPLGMSEWLPFCFTHWLLSDLRFCWLPPQIT